MDQFNLDDVRDSFQSDVKGHIRRCATALDGHRTGAVARQATVALATVDSWEPLIQESGVSDSPAFEAGSVLLAEMMQLFRSDVENLAAAERLQQGLIRQLLCANTGLSATFEQELVGNKDAARLQQMQVLEENDQWKRVIVDTDSLASALELAASRGVLGDAQGDLGSGDRALPGSFAEALVRVDDDVAAMRADAEAADQALGSALEVASHAYHAIRGSSSMVQLESLAAVSCALETLAESGRLKFASLSRVLERSRALLCACLELGTKLAEGLGLEGDELRAAGEDLEQSVLPALRAALDDDSWSTDEGESRVADAEDSAGFDAAIESVLNETDRPIDQIGDGIDSESGVDDGVVLDSAIEDEGVAFDSAIDEDGVAFDSFVDDSAVDGDDLDLGEASQIDFDSIAEGDSLVENPPSFEPEAEGMDSTLRAELVEIFQEEARGLVDELRSAYCTMLGAPTGDAQHVLRRVHHTLKGSAAIVGLTDFSEQAASLERDIDAASEAGVESNPAVIRGWQERTDALLRGAGLPGTSTGAAPAVAHDSELEMIFRAEALEILDAADEFCQQMQASAPADFYPGWANELERLFHRMKGSAVVSDVGEIAVAAEAVHAGCSSDTRPEDLRDLLVRELPRLREQVLALAGGDAEQQSVIDGVDAVSANSVLESASREPQFEVVRVTIELETEPTILEAFEIESAENFEAIERCLFELEQADQPKTLINDLLRYYHTLKGAVNTIGLDPVGEIIHVVESFLEHLIGETILPPMRSVSGLLLKVQDGIRQNLSQSKEGYVEVCKPLIEARIKSLIIGDASQVSAVASWQDSIQSAGSADSAARPTPTGRSETRQSGSSKSSGSSPGNRSKSTKDGTGGYIRVPTKRLENLMNLVGELVVSRSRARRNTTSFRRLQRALDHSCKSLTAAVEKFRETYEFHGIDGGRRRQISLANATRDESESTGDDRGFSDLELDSYDDINILARKLEEIGSDISAVQAEVGEELDTFNEESEVFGSIVSNLQAEITAARMVPVDRLFIRLRRPVRDAAERESKDVRVVTYGEDVTLDKTIVDALYEPLLHLVRNCVSHGIESQSDRLARLKDRSGTLTLSARQDSGNIVLEVSDDGNGIDLERVHRAGVAKGLIPADMAVDHPRVMELIFHSGLSTREQADAVAGRGIGCDIVRQSIEQLGGHIQVESAAGKGSKFIITLPLTLAIYRALIVENDGVTMALPLNFAERTFNSEEIETVTSSGARCLEVDNRYIEIRNLSSILELPASDYEGDRATVVIRMGEQRAVVEVDRILGQEEIVVKTMGALLTGHPMFSGVTISGDGNLVLILDVAGVFQGQDRMVSVAASSGSESGPLGDGAGADANRPRRRAGVARPARILYVDDSLSVRRAAEKFLSNLGIETTMAVDGVDGLEKMRKGNFDMVFTDLEMPRLHGYELIRELRFIPQFKDLPVVVVTSRSGEKHRQHAESLGATDYVTKPFSQAVLREMILKWTESKMENDAVMISSRSGATA